MSLVSNLQTFNRAIELIYEAALDEHVWPDALAQIAALHDGVRAFMYTPLVPPEEGGMVLTHDPVQVAEIQRWAARFRVIDPWVEAVQNKGLAQEGRPILSQDLVADAVLIQHPFYTEFLRHHNARHLCTGLVFLGRDPELPTLACGVHRGIQAQAFTDENRQLHGLLLRHISRAVGVMTRLRTQELQTAASLTALDRLEGPVILLNRQGLATFANKAALKALGREDGLRLQAIHNPSSGLGRLVGNTPAITSALDEDIAAALNPDPFQVRHFGPGLVVPKAHDKGHWIVRMSPLSDRGAESAAFEHAKVIVFLHDTATSWELDPQLLHQMYGLTSAETRVAQALLQQGSIDLIAKNLGVSESTIKTQLKALFEKTGSSRQTDLIKILMGLAKSRPN